MNYFDMMMLEPDPLSFDNDDEDFVELDIEAVDECPRCGIEFETDDEMEHIDWFTNLKEKTTGTVVDSELEVLGKSILRDVLGDQTFSLNDIDPSNIKQIEDLIKVAIEFEKDTVVFYEMVRSFIDNEETVMHLDKIIDEENRHVQRLQAFFHMEDDPLLPSISHDAE